MSILRLPDELILEIFEYLGRDFFCQDVRRLTVSRAWCKIARPFFMEEIRLNFPGIFKFSYHATVEDTFAEQLWYHTKAITINLGGCIWPGVPCDGDAAHDVIKQLGEVLQTVEPSNLSSLKILPGLEPQTSLELRVPGRTLSRLLTLETLGELEIDAGLWSMVPTFSDPERVYPHLCDSISTLLPRLRKLRCRMRSMCMDLLEPCAEDGFSSLQELIIDMSCPVRQDIDGLADGSILEAGEHTEICSAHYHREPFPNLINETVYRARMITSNLSDPKIIRVIYHKAQGQEKYAYDAIRNQWLNLGSQGATWDTPGKVIDEIEATRNFDLDAWNSEDEEAIYREFDRTLERLKGFKLQSEIDGEIGNDIDQV